MSSNKNSFEHSWLKNKLVGHQRYAPIPAALLLHPDVTNTDLRVFACLAAHVNKRGYVYITRQRIAEMCGYVEKGQPNVTYVSRIIGKSGSLVKLGFVKNLGQRGFDECCEYQLVVPDFDAMQDSPLRAVTSLRDTLYKSKKIKAIDEKNERLTFVHTVAGIDMIEYDGELVLRGRVEEDLRYWHEGLDRVYPDAVYAAFGIQIPEKREGY